jgi:ABC-type multidrug transport system permease subunit
MTLEFGLAPRSLAWVLVPKVVLALIFGLVSGTLFLAVIYVWLGFWPGIYIWAFWLLAGLTALFWIGLAIVIGLRSRNYMAGAIAIVLMAIIVFFIGGGLGLIRYHAEDVQWYSWLFPNTYAIDPIRDLVLFKAWPVDWNTTLIKLVGFAALSLLFGMIFTARRLRRLG